MRDLKKDLGKVLRQDYDLTVETSDYILKFSEEALSASRPKSVKQVYKLLKQEKLNSSDRKKVLRLIKEERTLNRRIKRLELMQRLFKYWHVVHLPFALIMLIIVIIHVAVTLAFGYKWIF